MPEYDRQNEEADIEKKWISMSEALDMVRSGQLNDAKTIIGLLLAGGIYCAEVNVSQMFNICTEK